MALVFFKKKLTGIFHDRITNGALGAYCLDTLDVLDAKALIKTWKQKHLTFFSVFPVLIFQRA